MATITPKTAIADPNGRRDVRRLRGHMRDGFELAFEERETRDHEAEADECERRAHVCEIRSLVCKRSFARTATSRSSMTFRFAFCILLGVPLGAFLANLPRHVYATHARTRDQGQPRRRDPAGPDRVHGHRLARSAPWPPARHPQSDRHAARREALSRAYPGEYLLDPGRRRTGPRQRHLFPLSPRQRFRVSDGRRRAGRPAGSRAAPHGHRSLLFVPEHNRGKAEFFTDRVHGELWVGPHRGVDESAMYYGVDACRPLAAS